jgi:Flp pilus assembly protein TadG
MSGYIEMRRRLAVIRADRRAVTALEFAFLAPVLFMLLFGATELGLVWWTKNALQVTAALTARCVALGSCSNPASFAVSSATAWALPDLISASDVTSATSKSCYGAADVFAEVTITCEFWGGSFLPAPLSNLTFSVTSCYPMAS